MATSTEPRSRRAKPRGSKVRDSIRKGLSHVYVGWWVVWYQLKLEYVGVAVGILLFFLGSVELLGPTAHLISDYSPKSWKNLLDSSYFHFGLAGSLFVVTAVMLSHHQYLHHKVARFKDLVQFSVSMSAIVRNDPDASPTGLAVVVLDGLLMALQGMSDPSEATRRVNASILVKADGAEKSFRILAQDSSNTFDRDIRVSGENSVAGKLVKFDRDHKTVGSLMYVPSTRALHAVAFTAEMEEGVFFSDTEIIPTSYEVIDETTQKNAIRSLLCAQIPLRQPIDSRERSYTAAVLSLSAKSEDCMGFMFFLGSKLACNILTDFL
jgi:hypothetical protein